MKQINIYKTSFPRFDKILVILPIAEVYGESNERQLCPEIGFDGERKQILNYLDDFSQTYPICTNLLRNPESDMLDFFLICKFLKLFRFYEIIFRFYEIIRNIIS